jgi:hypothetical protein
MSYLISVLTVLVTASVGIALMITTFGEIIGFVLVLLSGIIFLAVIRPRATLLRVPKDWPVQDWNIRAREMHVLRLRYIRAAMRDRGIPDAVAYGVGVLAILAIAVAFVSNSSAYF